MDSRHRANSLSSPRARIADAEDIARRADAAAAAAAGEGASARGWRRMEKGRKEERRWEAERRAMAIAA
jgi:hypothetical protein